MNKILILPVVAALCSAVAMPSSAHASECESNYQKLQRNLKAFNAVIARGVCESLARAGDQIDEAQADQCLEQWNKAVEEAKKYKDIYQSTNTGSGKIGPRGFAHERTYSGGLMTERLFIGREILSDEYTVDFEPSGGKKNKDYTVTVCFVDRDGEQVIKPYTRRITGNEPSKGFDKKFSGVSGARPLVYLRSSHWVSTNTNKYRFRGTQGPAPRTVQAARKAKKKAEQDRKNKSRNNQQQRRRPGTPPKGSRPGGKRPGGQQPGGKRPGPR